MFNVHKLRLSIFDRRCLCAKGVFRNSAVCAITMSIGAQSLVQNVHFWEPSLAADAEFLD